MAKRFTDTEKWDKAWFRKLSLKMKCVWFYLCDKCDHAGVWEIDLETMGHFIGQKISLLEITNTFGYRVTVRENDKLFVESFVTFQYGILNPENRAHKSVISKLEKLAPYKGLTSPFEGATNGAKDMDTDKEMVKVKEGGVGEFDFELAWAKYPNQVDKGDAKLRFKSLIKTQKDFDELLIAIPKYISDCDQKKRSYKHFASFLGTNDNQRWKEWVIPNVGTSGAGTSTNWDKVFEGTPA